MTTALLANGYPGLERVFFCVGAQKAGTTWIWSMLQDHPECHLPPVKEVRYWDWRFEGPHRFAQGWADARVRELEQAWRRAVLLPWRLRAASRSLGTARHYARILRHAPEPESRADYVAYLMTGHAGQPVAGELTPNYQLLDAEEFRAMAALHPETRFVFVMRDPVDRLWSGVKHLYRAALRAGTMPDAELLARFRDAVADPDDLNHRRCDYPRTIAALEAAVPAERVLYLFYETLFDPGAYRRLTDFLGLAPGPVDPERRLNESRRPGLAPPDADLAAARAMLDPVYVAVAARFGAAVPDRWRERPAP